MAQCRLETFAKKRSKPFAPLSPISMIQWQVAGLFTPSSKSSNRSTDPTSIFIATLLIDLNPDTHAFQCPQCCRSQSDRFDRFDVGSGHYMS